MVTSVRSWATDQSIFVAPGERTQATLSSWVDRLIVFWLMGMMVLLPVDLVHLPLNMALVDVWILLGTPLFWLAFLRGSYVISWLYALPMWLILVASFAGTFATPAPSNSLVVLLKEIYAYVWFVTMTAVLARLNRQDLRRVLVVWAGTLLLHGLIIVGQFVSPAFWRFTGDLAGSAREFDIYRPSGLLMNANSAALFQLLGFVPLALVSRSQKSSMILVLLLLPSMLLTGSMGAALAFCTGLAVAMVALALNGYLAVIIRTCAQLGLVLLVLGGALFVVISQNQRYQEHFTRIFLGRSEKSSEGRFYLWQRGLDVFVEHDALLWGVGPENFRKLDAAGHDNQLHNDFLAFLVERGLLGALGLALFALVALSRAAYLLLLRRRHPDHIPLNVVVFLAAVVATIVESLTHQVFHFRELWLVLAFQEAMFFQSRKRTEQAP